VIEGQQFKVEGSIGDEVRTEIEGHGVKVGGEGEVRLQLHANMRLIQMIETSGSRGARATDAGVNLNTTIVAQRGQTVVIGSAPAGFKRGESAILVVRIK
jgi:hypothetical protein